MIKSFFSLFKKKKSFYFKTENVLSSKKMLNLLDSGIKIFCNKDKVYLEIGVYMGGTLTKLAENNKNIRCIGVDDFLYLIKIKIIIK